MLAGLIVCMAQTAWAGPADMEARRLSDCLAAIEADPAAAYESALAWTFEGNRAGARYCTALSLIALGNNEEGARRLEMLATSTDGGTIGQRAAYLAQAGHAWLQAGAGEAAITAFSEALKLEPADPGLRLDRAAGYILADQPDAALRDLDNVIAERPADAVAHQMRAGVHLALGLTEKALSDITVALAGEPENIDTLVLRGRIREAIRIRSEMSQPAE
jgi:tetratricopeptide (TPR) repeat protein